MWYDVYDLRRIYMKNAFLLEKNANNIGIIRINDTFKICIRDLDNNTTYFLEEKTDSEVSKDLLAFGCITLVDFITKQLVSDIKALRQLESDNLFAEAKLNATTLAISGKVIIQSKYAMREDLLAFEALLNKHERFLQATKDETIINHEEAINDSFNASPVSY